eukprot:gene23778-9337_t
MASKDNEVHQLDLNEDYCGRLTSYPGMAQGNACLGPSYACPAHWHLPAEAETKNPAQYDDRICYSQGIFSL